MDVVIKCVTYVKINITKTTFSAVFFIIIVTGNVQTNCNDCPCDKEVTTNHVKSQIMYLKNTIVEIAIKNNSKSSHWEKKRR